MTLVEDPGTVLHWSVLTAKRPGLSRDLPPGQEKWTWVANSSTLVSGKRDAVLVDTFLTTEQSQCRCWIGWSRGAKISSRSTSRMDRATISSAAAPRRPGRLRRTRSPRREAARSECCILRIDLERDPVVSGLGGAVVSKPS